MQLKEKIAHSHHWSDFKVWLEDYKQQINSIEECEDASVYEEHKAQIGFINAFIEEMEETVETAVEDLPIIKSVR